MSRRAPDDPADRFAAEALPHLDGLHRVAWRLTRHQEEAADLVQETLLRAFRTFAGFRPGTDCRAWLFTILYSIFANRYRQRQRRPPEVSLQALEQKFERELAAAEWEDPMVRLAAGRYGAGEAVDAALDALPAEYRGAIVLVDLEELTYEEAAAAMACPVGTVRSRLARGRRLLAALLRESALEPRLAEGDVPR